MAMLLFLFALPIFLIFLFTGKYKSLPNSRRPPGPKGLPFIGNIHQFDTRNPHLWLAELSTKYGPLMSVILCQVPIVVISSADVAKKALKHNDLAFAGRPYTTASLRFSYDHSDIICSFYSDYWKEMRKMTIRNLFSPQKVRSFRSVREDEVSRLMVGICKKAGSDQPFNVGAMIMSFNWNLLCRVAFGKKMDEGHAESWTRFEKIVDQFNASLLETFLADYFPLFGWINKLSGAAQRLEKVFKDMDSFYQELIDEHLSPNRPDSMKDDILDLLIQLRDDHSAPVKIDWKHVKAILMNVFIGGTDTTGATITWALTALMKNPSVMKRVQHEIRSLVGKKSAVDEDDIQKLPYLKAVIKETMRLYPAIPLVPKATTERCIINGYEIQPNTFVMVNTWAINRDPEYWENPNDFLPDRFLNTNIDYKGQDFGFIPFGSGRRICVGLPLAAANTELALANLLYFFNWEIPHGMTEEDIDVDSSTGFVLQRKNPLCLMAKVYV